MRRANWLIGALALGMAGTACDTVEPGDYVVYRVASTSSKLSDGCYFDYQGADANVRQDSSTLKSSTTFVLYAGVETERLLDIGPVTLDGEFTGEFTEGEVYEFEGKTVDIEFANPDGTGSGAKRTTTVETNVDLTVDGKLAFGEVKIKSTWSCNGEGCGQMPPACTETIEFVGTEVEDVNLEHDVPYGFGATASTGSGPVDDDSGVGGAGAAGGAGGAGGQGGGPTCSTCSDVLYAEGAPEELCETSYAPFNDLLSCACGDCASVCGENMCVDPSAPDAACESCISELCYIQYDVCLADEAP